MVKYGIIRAKRGNFFKLLLDSARIANFTTAHITFFNCTFRVYNCTNCDQLHTNICPGQ